MDSVIVGVLAAGCAYTTLVIGLCMLVVHRWWMTLFLVINVIVFLILVVGYIKKWILFGWFGETYDMCYWLCQLRQYWGSFT